jgi:hypothetical protein
MAESKMSISTQAQDPFSKLEALSKKLARRTDPLTAAEMLGLQVAAQQATQFAQQLQELGIGDVSAFRAASLDERVTLVGEALKARVERMQLQMIKDAGRGIT